MSGQQLGSAVGFVAGFFLPGGPAVWSAIGPCSGGSISAQDGDSFQAVVTTGIDDEAVL